MARETTDGFMFVGTECRRKAWGVPPRSVPEIDRARFSAVRLSAIGLGYRPPTVTSVAPLQFLILLVASWIGRRQGEAIEYLRADKVRRIPQAPTPFCRIGPSVTGPKLAPERKTRGGLLTLTPRNHSVARAGFEPATFGL
jgi:hypothetical protein